MSTRSLIDMIRKNAITTGTTIPNSIQDAFAARLAATEFLDELEAHRNPRRLARAVLDALAAGNNPETDQAVQKAQALHSLAQAGIANTAAEVAEADVFAAVREHEGELIDSWRPTLEAATQALHDGLAELGAIDLADHASVVKKGGAAAEAWVAVASANRTVETLKNSWCGLMLHVHTLTIDRRWPGLVFLDADSNARIKPEGSTAWDYVRAGATDLVLTTADGFRQRLNANQEAIAAEAERAAREEQRRVSDYYGAGRSLAS